MFKEIILYIEKNKSVNALLIAALAIIVSFQLSKSMPALFNWNVDVVNYYYDIGVNLSISYIVSTIFYVLVVYYPERKKNLAIRAKTSILFARLQTNMGGFIDCVLQSANLDLKVDEDIESVYLKSLANIDLITCMRETRTDEPFVDNVSCLEKAINAAKKIELLKNSLIPFITYLNDDELDLYLELEDTFIFENFGEEKELFLKEYLIKSEFNLLVEQYNNCQKVVGASFRKVSW
ncbi:hypothetical protein [Aliivibrio fischeri]|uniref:hypothetical protein n=1 Tax=Aliivibrio fischeri TaxID=668 RepID=UPI00080ED3D8|nr:hypothetical protein [Aliivibrio fischeri]OCH12311.1 hypothetical protein A6E09_18880 [Aliivibrio fischeri]